LLLQPPATEYPKHWQVVGEVSVNPYPHILQLRLVSSVPVPARQPKIEEDM